MTALTIGAGVFLHNGRKVLLVRQKVSGMWSLPKGSKEVGECNDKCWRRELAEETGILSMPFHRVTKSVDILKYNISIVELFTDNLPLPTPLDPDEIAESKWVSLKTVLSYNLNHVTKQTIRDNFPSDNFASFQSCRRMTPRYNRRCSTQRVTV
jgi:8-oxo-dGTP pyrophosphatase MutT (NUDIX family)